METINLIPKEERVQQTKTKVVKFSTVISIIILVIVAGVGGYFYYRVSTVKTELEAIESNIASLRSQINNLSEIEIEARNLYKKSTVITDIFNSRIYYSKMLEELEASTPETVKIRSFGLAKENSINLSGGASNYNDVQEFSNRLLESPLFTEVQLSSVGLEGGEDKVNFFVIVKYDLEVLYE